MDWDWDSANDPLLYSAIEVEQKFGFNPMETDLKHRGIMKHPDRAVVPLYNRNDVVEYAKRRGIV